jgi:hypothetical protein
MPTRRSYPALRPFSHNQSTEIYHNAKVTETKRLVLTVWWSKTIDWIIDLGPENSDGGGKIVPAGTPEDIAREKRSYTGAFLKPVLARRSNTPKKKCVKAGRSDIFILIDTPSLIQDQ